MYFHLHLLHPKASEGQLNLRFFIPFICFIIRNHSFIINSLSIYIVIRTDSELYGFYLVERKFYNIEKAFPVTYKMFKPCPLQHFSEVNHVDLSNRHTGLFSYFGYYFTAG